MRVQGDCPLATSQLSIMLGKIEFALECVKVARGAASVASASASLQLARLKTFMKLLGFNSCSQYSKKLNSISSSNAGRCTAPKAICGRTIYPDFSARRRIFSTSVGDSSQTQKKKKSPSKQRHVPASRIGRAVGFGSN